MAHGHQPYAICAWLVVVCGPWVRVDQVRKAGATVFADPPSTAAVTYTTRILGGLAGVALLIQLHFPDR